MTRSDHTAAHEMFNDEIKRATRDIEEDDDRIESLEALIQSARDRIYKNESLIASLKKSIEYLDGDGR